MAQQLHNKVDKRVLKAAIAADKTPRTTISFYNYYQIKNPKLFRDHLYILLSEIGVLGRIYVAHEGINAQISVPTKNLPALKECLDSISFLHGIRLNKAVEDDPHSFIKLIIKVRAQIVADGIDDPNFNPSDKGTHLKAAAFNALAAKEDTVIIDMRNHYESEVGHFEGAITPDVTTFRESLPIIADMMKPHQDKHIIMYCTGGIRCEKASAYMKYRGYDNVYQLEGGIIKYAHDAEAEGLENKFIGKNFVFDERLGERISDEVIAHCHQCGAVCDTHINCANDHCHLLFIQCEKCADKYDACCSQKCQDFNKNTEEERRELGKTAEFNGSKFSKARYQPSKSGIFLS